MDYWLYIRLLFLVALLFASGFFSGTEVALFSLTRMQREKLRETKGRAGARVDALLSNPQRLLVSLYIGNELVNVAISAVTTFVALSLFGSAGLAIALGAGTFMLLIFGEISPKTIAHYHNEKWALLTAYPLSAFMWVIQPFQNIVTRVANSIVKLTVPCSSVARRKPRPISNPRPRPRYSPIRARWSPGGRRTRPSRRSSPAATG